jgi:hypothetical protein
MAAEVDEAVTKHPQRMPPDSQRRASIVAICLSREETFDDESSSNLPVTEAGLHVASNSATATPFTQNQSVALAGYRGSVTDG